MSKYRGDSYCQNSFATENKRESHKKVCENKDFCSTVLPSKDAIILDFNKYQKFDKAPVIIYKDF